MKVVCPKCGSDQLSAQKQGFSAGKAVAGAVLTGGVGLLAGTIGSSKVKCTCLACGNTFAAGAGKRVYEAGEVLLPQDRPANPEALKAQRKTAGTMLKVVGIVLAVMIVIGTIGYLSLSPAERAGKIQRR